MGRQAGDRSSAGSASGPRSGQGNAHQHATSPWEWVAAALGALLIGSALVYMAQYGLSRPRHGPPEVIVQPVAIVPVDGGYLVQFRARNTGDSTAAQLLVGGELQQGGATVEESEATLDYLPEHSEREGGLFFTRDPARYELKLRAKGYAKP